MTIETGSTGLAADIDKIVVSNLESINQNTILSQDATVTDKNYTYAETDTLSDSNGYNNTIDTGNTTAIFSTDRYVPDFAGGNPVVDDNGHGPGASQSQTLKNGYKILTNQQAVLTKITKLAGCDATIAYLLDSSKVVIAQANFSGDDALFTVDNILANATTYYVAVDDGGASYDRRLTSAVTYPLTDTNIDWTGGLSNGADSTSEGNAIDNITTEDLATSASVVQTNSKTFGSNVSSILVSANKVLNGSSTMTFDVSTDGGSSFEKTAQALETVISVDGDDTDVVLKFNLGISGTDGAELLGYSYQVWS